MSPGEEQQVRQLQQMYNDAVARAGQAEQQVAALQQRVEDLQRSLHEHHEHGYTDYPQQDPGPLLQPTGGWPRGVELPPTRWPPPRYQRM